MSNDSKLKRGEDVLVMITPTRQWTECVRTSALIHTIRINICMVITSATNARNLLRVERPKGTLLMEIVMSHH